MPRVPGPATRARPPRVGAADEDEEDGAGAGEHARLQRRPEVLLVLRLGQEEGRVVVLNARLARLLGRRRQGGRGPGVECRVGPDNY